jgi:hypothetical protein
MVIFVEYIMPKKQGINTLDVAILTLSAFFASYLTHLTQFNPEGMIWVLWLLTPLRGHKASCVR